jgi:putative ABC transport system permease protein
MGDLARDLTYALRTLLRAPLLLVTTVLTLGIGIGLSTGVLAVAYGVLLRPLPYDDPSRLVVISLHRPVDPARDVGLPLPDVDEWRRRVRAFEHVAAHSDAEFTFRGAGDPRTVRGAMVTDEFFAVLGVSAAEGTTADIVGATPAVAFGRKLAEQLGSGGPWRARGVTIGSAHFNVAAVMPPTFTFPGEQIDVWVPAQAVPKISFFVHDDQRRFHLIARLAAGVSLAQAQDDAARVAGELNAGRIEGRQRMATVSRLDDHLRQGVRAAVAPFVAGALLVLLIAGANVSGLLVARASSRAREFAVRRALGGGTAHLVRVSLAESAAIAMCGWALGLGLAHLVIRGFTLFGADAVANLQSARLDGPVIAGSLLLTGIVALGSGAAPAVRALRSESASALKQTPGRTGGQGRALRGTLVVAQIGLTIVLLVSAGLLTRTVMTIVASERGFELRNGMATRLMLSETTRFNVSERAPFVERLVSEIRALPGVVAAGVGSDLPPNGAQLMMTINLDTSTGPESFPLSMSAVTPGYLEAIGATRLRGRLFEDQDRTAAVPVVVITEAAARRLFFDRDPVGKNWPGKLPTPSGPVEPLIVGVIRDVKYGGLDREAPAAIFTGWERLAPSQAYLVVRTTGDPLAVAPAVRQTLQRLEPSLPLFPAQSLEEVAAGSMAERRLRLQLAAVFAVLALVLAAVALWGAMAQSVLDRRRELAIRLALGSSEIGAVGLLMRGGGTLVLAGVAIGTAGAFVSARTLRHLLHGVAPFDPLTFVAGIGLATAVSLLACYLPARRAASISPAELLREG